MKQTWTRMEDNLRTHAPHLLEDLHGPASDADIAELEHHLGLGLPSDFVASLKIHNGQKAVAGYLFGDAEYLSTGRILAEWRIWKDLSDHGEFQDIASQPDPEIQPGWWLPRWIPFTYNGAGDSLCLDLSPSAQGTCGQVITLWHDDARRKKKAESFGAWLADFAAHQFASPSRPT